MNEGIMEAPKTGEHVAVRLRWLIGRDRDEVLAIEKASFEFPWTEQDFAFSLHQRNCIGMVAEHAGKVVGFYIYELYKTRIHVVNFAVHPDFRRRGVGRQMVVKLIGKLHPLRRGRIVLEVPESLLNAQLFFKATGFTATNILKDYYESNPEEAQEDAFVFQYRLEAS